ncbi:hypothetical protein ILUMI_06522 [Ignelater luminosus]|uniref:RanBD1 domain-containing protein n=1 Tax=Ignelater luminosus TaxID=2038154 RepID=A0A8K0DAY2_IGNLU|nr:hypothetical protein ILUMI_06522 [Ignelater luminosus]
MSELGENNTRDRTLSGSSNHSESDVDAHYEPIIRLPEVKISTNEEEEVVLLKLRARLYRFDTTNEEGPEWKERGTGELKLLRHKENNSVRIVMRRDKTFKVCANHFITPWMELKPSTGTDKAFVYTVAADFADEQAKTECLAVKFGTAELANQFKDKFNEARNIVKTKCKLYIDDENEDSEEELSETNSHENNDVEENLTKQVREKLSNLDVSKEETKEDEASKK